MVRLADFFMSTTKEMNFGFAFIVSLFYFLILKLIFSINICGFFHFLPKNKIKRTAAFRLVRGKAPNRNLRENVRNLMQKTHGK